MLWHQSFLSFAQRYKNDISEEQRDVLLDVVLEKGHREIGPEIRRELLEGRGREVAAAQQQQKLNGDVEDVEMDL